MKNLFLAAAVAVGMFFTSNAQEMKFGAKAGLNITNVDIDGFDTDSRTGFHIGATYNIGVNESLAIQPELLYSTAGAKASTGDGELNLSYIDIPVMVQYNISSVQGLSLEVGPQIGFLVAAEDQDENDLSDSYKSTNIGLNVGVGYSLESGLSFGARYNYGLTDIIDVNGGNETKTNGFLLSVGYTVF